MPEAVSAVPAAARLETLLDAVREAAALLGLEVYLVGGFVRDRLRGAEGKDVDLVAVGDDGVGLLQTLSRRFGWAPPQRFERFGTAQIRGDGFVVEVVRARAESYDPASRRPDVRPGSLEDDVWRRDFTVNALCQTLDGRVIDVTGHGIADLLAGVLRTPLDPTVTFAEDPLRMLRAARFVAQLGFRLAPGVLEAMRASAERTDILSIERISDELRKLLCAPHARAGMNVLRDGGLLHRLLPEVDAMRGVEQGGYHVYDVYDHTLHALERAPAELVTRLAVLLHDVGKPPTHALLDGRHTFHDHPQVGAEMARRILTRLRFSNDEIAAVTRLVRLHLRPIQYEESTFGDAAVRRLIRDAGELRRQLLDVARADTEASAFPTTAGIDGLQRRMAALDAGGAVSAMRDPLSGDEIMALAQRGAGPWVGRVKAALREAVIDGALAPGDREAARAWLHAHPELLVEAV